MESSAEVQRGGGIELIASTFAFTVCFSCWILNAVLVSTLVSQGTFRFDQSQIGWLLAAPILTGALSRVPLGILTDRHGGRAVFAVAMIASAGPLYLLSHANGFASFLGASFGFGLAGGTFAVGVAYVSLWFDKARQGVALGVFGLGNVGAALTTTFVPALLSWTTDGGAMPEGWRLVPKLGAAALVLTAIAFFLVVRTKKVPAGPAQTLSARLAPLRSVVVWRFGLYYFLVFGGFVTLAQWLIPYGVNVYELGVQDAGKLASIFSLPAAVVGIAGGFLADRFGARPMMTWVFYTCILVCLSLSIPRMEVTSPGVGLLAAAPGEVTAIGDDAIRVDDRVYPLAIAIPDGGGPGLLPRIRRSQEPAVTVGARVVKGQLIARGVTNIHYPADRRGFIVLIAVLGVAFGVGKSVVLKFIPEQFPQSVGAVGGIVGLVGALSGFFFPILFGYLLSWTGIWTTCWIVLFLLSVACLVSLQVVAARMLREEAPDLARMLERRPATPLPGHAPGDGTMEELLKGVSFFRDLSDSELRKLLQLGRKQAVSAGETIFEEGSPGATLYIVLDGSIRIAHQAPGASAVEFGKVERGQYFGEIALLDGSARSATATAVTDGQLFLLDRSDFLALLSKSPRMVADLLVGLSGIVRSSDTAFAAQSRQAGTSAGGPIHGESA